MKFVWTFLFIMLSQMVLLSQGGIRTTIDTIEDNRLIMIQEFEVNAPVDKVWDAYTTKEGWEGWAVPLAEVDWRQNGTIKTNYNPNGKIGDESTIVTHIINYVPYRIITVQAEITENFPSFMKEDEKSLFNVINFEELTAQSTKVTSYGIGYKNNEKYQELMQYFIQANKQTTEKLISYLEK